VSPRRGRRPRVWNRYDLSHPANGEADAHSTIEGSILFAAFELSAPPKVPPTTRPFRRDFGRVTPPGAIFAEQNHFGRFPNVSLQTAERYS
jgi:hypothetical protein